MDWHSGNKIIGPVFLNRSHKGDIYVDLLENTMESLIGLVIEDQIVGEPHLNQNPLHPQLDSANRVANAISGFETAGFLFKVRKYVI